MDEKMLKLIAIIILIIGGLNWGLVGLININLVALIFGSATLITRIIYIVVGLAALYVGYLKLMKA